MTHAYQPPPESARPPAPIRPRKRRSGVQVVGLSILAGALVLGGAGGLFATFGHSGGKKAASASSTAPSYTTPWSHDATTEIGLLNLSCSSVVPKAADSVTCVVADGTSFDLNTFASQADQDSFVAPLQATDCLQVGTGFVLVSAQGKTGPLMQGEDNNMKVFESINKVTEAGACAQ